MKKKYRNINLNPLKPEKYSSLYHLAYGHLAFRAWRKLKINASKKHE